MRLTNMVCYGTLLGLCAACASAQTANAPPSAQANDTPSYQDLKQNELAAERQEYIHETQKKLSEVDRDMQHVQAKLDHESKFVGKEKQESWKQELFELRQERAGLQRRLERARSASPEEWEAMRGPIGTATDSLQASVKKLRADVSEALRLEEEDTASRPVAHSELCRVEVSGVEADVERAGQRVTVTLTADGEGNINKLQRRAAELARSTDSYRITRQDPAKASDGKPTSANADKPAPEKTADPAVDKHGPNGDPPRVAVNVVAEKMATGAKLTFVSKEGATERLRERLALEAQNLEDGRCNEAQVSMNTASK